MGHNKVLNLGYIVHTWDFLMPIHTLILMDQIGYGYSPHLNGITPHVILYIIYNIRGWIDPIKMLCEDNGGEVTDRPSSNLDEILWGPSWAAVVVGAAALDWHIFTYPPQKVFGMLCYSILILMLRIGYSCWSIKARTSSRCFWYNSATALPSKVG